MKLSRRDFLAIAGLGVAGCSSRPIAQPRAPIVDFHVHLMGVGDGGTGCFLSPAQRELRNYRFLLTLLGLSENGRMDQDYVEFLVRQLRASSIAQAVLVGQDKRYDGNGHPDDEATAFYVPNDYVFQIVRQYPELFVPCVSINPKRRDAMDELEKCAADGARVLKIHPPIQDVDPAAERFRPFYRRVAELDIVLMVHTGAEHSAVVVDDALSDPAGLAPALEEGCTVVAAHSGMSAVFDDTSSFRDFFPNLIALAERFPNLYCDSAVLASMFRWRNIPQLLDNEILSERLVHASDFPFPSNALVFWNRLSPAQTLRLCSESNLFERDYRIKHGLGVSVGAFERGAQLLGG